jgi:peptidoglycan hydrolase CwlO-like protein
MNDEERQRTMDFILQQQAQFSANMQMLEERQSQLAEQQAQFATGMQRLEEQQSQLTASQQMTNGRMDRLERVVVLMAQQFRRERRDLRERIAALVDAQVKTEEITRQNSEAIRALTKGADERNGGGNRDAS